MLSMVVLIPAGFGMLVWRSYRAEASRARRGEAFRPTGKVRWSGD